MESWLPETNKLCVWCQIHTRLVWVGLLLKLQWHSIKGRGREEVETVKWRNSQRRAARSAFACLLNGSCHLLSGWRRQTRRLPFASSGQKTHIISDHSWLLWRAAAAAISPERLTANCCCTHTHTRCLISYSAPHCCCWGSLACTDSLKAYDGLSTENTEGLK